jgi:hypothetical protein
MPVRKFRDVSEMKDVWYEPGDPTLFRALQNIWAFARLVCAPTFPPGVYKHRSVVEMNAQTEQWQEANFRAFQARRAETGAVRPAEPEREKK